MIELIYNLCFIPIANIYILLGKFFNKKLKQRDIACRELIDKFKPIDNNFPTYWFHASSMGEFEQAKPVIENIKALNKSVNIVVTFFSPSGYENQKDYIFADRILYLPLDSRRNVRSFLDLIKPDKAVFVRYEIWFNFLTELKNRNIFSVLICATKPASKFVDSFPLLNFYKKAFNLFESIFTVDDGGFKYFDSFCKCVKKSADTRFDRIIDRVESSKESKLIPQSFIKDSFIIVVGSSWEPEEKIIIESNKRLNNNIKYIIVPHEPTDEHIKKLKNNLSDFLFLSSIQTYSEQQLIETKFLIVDSIGKLLELYNFADIAFVGGAFGVGVHSVTEAAGYGIPILTGPRMTNSPDAIALSKIGVLSQVSDTSGFVTIVQNYIDDIKLYNQISEQAKQYVFGNKGISREIANYLLDS